MLKEFGFFLVDFFEDFFFFLHGEIFFEFS